MSCLALPVAICLATHNSARFLGEQLQSLCAQDYDNWHVILSDDGSRDETLALAHRAIPAARLTILKGPNLGPAQNFLSMLAHVPTGHAVAFCDHDDVWLPDKLSRAMNALAHHHKPAFYTSNRLVTDAGLSPIGPDYRRRAGFASLLLRGRAAGNTMVLNAAALERIKGLSASPPNVPFHDWWVSLALVGSGAKWLHDPRATVLYRQHTCNYLGASGGRLRRVYSGQYHSWLRANISALTAIESSLTHPNQNWLRRIARGLHIQADTAQLRSDAQADNITRDFPCAQAHDARFLRQDQKPDGRRAKTAPARAGHAAAKTLLRHWGHSRLF